MSKKVQNLLLILILFISFSCDNEKQFWSQCRKKNTFKDYFSFSMCNQNSIYVDSAILIMNQYIKNDNKFFLRFTGDSISYFSYDFDPCCIRRSSVLFYNIDKNELIYCDSIIKGTNRILRRIDIFIGSGERNNVFVFSESLTSKKSWINLFNKIDTVISRYNIRREKYSKILYNNPIDKISNTEKDRLLEKVPINLNVYFRNPLLPPMKIKFIPPEFK